MQGPGADAALGTYLAVDHVNGSDGDLQVAGLHCLQCWLPVAYAQEDILQDKFSSATPHVI